MRVSTGSVVAVVGWLVAAAAGFAIGRSTGVPATAPHGAPSEAPAPAERAERGASPGAASPLLRGAPAAGDRPSTHVDVDLRWFAVEEGTARGREDVGERLTFELIRLHVLAGRIPDAVAVVRAALASGTPALQVAVALRDLDPSRVVALIDALQREGIEPPVGPARWAELRALVGRAAEVVAADASALSDVGDADAFLALAKEAVRKGVGVAEFRAQAERDAWPDWKRSRVGDALAAGRRAEAAAWRAWAEERTATEARASAAAEARQREDDVAAARRHAAAAPGDPDAWVALGHALLWAEDPAGAADAYDWALELNPFFDGAAAALASTAPDRLVRRVADRWREVREENLLLHLAEAYLRLGRGREAAETVFRCADLPALYLAAGISALAPEVALRSIEPPLGRAGGRDALLLGARALAEAALGRTADAEETVRRLLEEGDGAEEWTVALDAAPSTALARFEAWRAKPLPDGDDRRAFLGEALRRAGRLEEAREVVEPFVAARPEWPTWEHSAAYVAAIDPERWAPRLRAVLDRDAEDVIRWVSWATFCALVGRRDEALAAFDRAIALDDGMPSLRVRRLRVH